MRYLVWLLRVALFVALLGFALKNDQPITLRYFFGYGWNTSLVVVLLCFFAAGAAVGILAMMGSVMAQRRELTSTKRDLRSKQKLDQAEENSHLPIQPS
jgi:uncharacterized integral membrane protein